MLPNLLARHAELLHDLCDAKVLEVLDDRGHGQARALEDPGAAHPTRELSTAGHWDQSSNAMVGTTSSRLRQTGPAVTRVHAAPRSPSRRFSQPWIWIQLANVRVTNLRSRLPMRA
jgi:hypothetical protein